ncbi:serine/threonine-protein phosphatase 6 regulatory ankyrin repeat subunit B-like [Asterias rubens]|uniref:serine/threonine-protein phosphatase 6 regulatory ankyrin repeat subunit B-like n=1 Tax=Asterias rubens TaxID=7604 RepID=UPI0014552DC9|nr:serine/threonine-protein phosphatase 6 regulatory ankyrin repeat subunit B-like [Asterias rubens]
MGNFLANIWPNPRRVSASAVDGLAFSSENRLLTFASSASTSRGEPIHQRVSSVDHLERLTELHNCIIMGRLNDFRRCLDVVVTGSVDELFPARLVAPRLASLAPMTGFCRSEPPTSLCLLHEAASRGRPDMLVLLLRAGASPNVLDSKGESALHHAAKNPEFCHALHFHCCTDRSQLLRRWACGSHHCVEILCSAPGADLNIRSQVDMGTPLHRACEAGREAIVEVLLSHGANPNVLNRYGETPAAMALISGHEVVFRRFLDMGVLQGRIDAIPFILHTAVNAYVEFPDLEKFNNIIGILQYDGDLNEQDHLGNTALHYAVAGRMVDFQLVSTLLTKGSNPDLVNKMGRSALIEFLFSHQTHINNANIRSVVLLASYMTTTPSIPPGQVFAVSNNPLSLSTRLYDEITEIVRHVSRTVPSLGHLCRQTLRRSIGPHHLGDPSVMDALPLPVSLRESISNRVDPESFCGYLLDFLLEREFSNDEPMMATV